MKIELMKNIAIITARSGSKELKDKNIRPLAGKPLMAWSIEAALETNLFDTVMVSTDSEKYAVTARRWGAEVPFLRSTVTSSDKASSWAVVDEVLARYTEIGKTFDTFCLLQPTSPLRTSDDLVAAYEQFESKNAIAVIGMCELEHPLAWCGTMGDSLSLDGFMGRDSGRQRQSQVRYYHPNGALFIADINEYKKDSFLYRKGSYAYVMSPERSVDIDCELDFQFAEFLMERKNSFGDKDIL